MQANSGGRKNIIRTAINDRLSNYYAGPWQQLVLCVCFSSGNLQHSVQQLIGIQTILIIEIPP